MKQMFASQKFADLQNVFSSQKSDCEGFGISVMTSRQRQFSKLYIFMKSQLPANIGYVAKPFLYLNDILYARPTTHFGPENS